MLSKCSYDRQPVEGRTAWWKRAVSHAWTQITKWLSSFRWPHTEETKEVWCGDRGHQSKRRPTATSHSTTDGHLPRNVLELRRAKTIVSASQLQATSVQRFEQFYKIIRQSACSVGDRGHKATSPTIQANAEDFLLTIVDDMFTLCPEATTVSYCKRNRDITRERIFVTAFTDGTYPKPAFFTSWSHVYINIWCSEHVL
jgi:hypothetical protein